MKKTWMKNLKEDLKQNWKGYAIYGTAVVVSCVLSSLGLGKFNPEEWARY